MNKGTVKYYLQMRELRRRHRQQGMKKSAQKNNQLYYDR